MIKSEHYMNGKPLGFKAWMDHYEAPAQMYRGVWRIVCAAVWGYWWIVVEWRRRSFVRDCHRLLDDLERKYSTGSSRIAMKQTLLDALWVILVFLAILSFTPLPEMLGAWLGGAP